MQAKFFFTLPENIRQISGLYELMQNGILHEQDLLVKGMSLAKTYMAPPYVERWVDCLKVDEVIPLVRRGLLKPQDFIKVNTDGDINVMQPSDAQLWVQAMARADIADLIKKGILVATDVLRPNSLKVLANPVLDNLVKAVQVPGVIELIQTGTLKVSDLWLEGLSIMSKNLITKLLPILSDKSIQPLLQKRTVSVEDFLTKGKFDLMGPVSLATAKQIVEQKIAANMTDAHSIQQQPS